MALEPRRVAFFDIGNTLASVRASDDGQRIEDLTVYPYIPAVLTKLRRDGVHLGILSDRGSIPAESVQEALDRAGLLSFFAAELILYGAKNSTRLFEQAAAAARGAFQPDRLLFVGEDATERFFAQRADFLVAPHPRLALTVLDRQGPLLYLRIRIPAMAVGSDWRAILRDQPLAFLHLAADSAPDQSIVVYALGDADTALRLDDMGFFVDRLGVPDEPLTTDLYLLRDDQQADSGFGSPEGNAFDSFSGTGTARRVLASSEEGLVVVVPALRSVESYHFAATRHGHNLKLVASDHVLGDGPGMSDEPLTPTGDGDTFAPQLQSQEAQLVHQHVTAEQITSDVARYSASEAASNTDRIDSRHIHHQGNERAVAALLRDLSDIGAGRLTVRRHRFTHEGKPYDNVEAILPARDGFGGVVVMSAHLDSTAARQPGYRAEFDSAPGADDDASGVAGVLAAARAMLALDAALQMRRRELRFVLFNAEEHGLVGSDAYAKDQALLRADIVAAVQMDMIGHDAVAPHAFELHAGFRSSAAVQTRSKQIATLIAAMVPEVASTLPAPQIYPVDGGADPAEGRSDHYSFQRAGYPACLSSEDFFAGPGQDTPEPNPNYHLPADTTINPIYAAGIARAVSAAAWVLATR